MKLYQYLPDLAGGGRDWCDIIQFSLLYITRRIEYLNWGDPVEQLCSDSGLL